MRDEQIRPVTAPASVHDRAGIGVELRSVRIERGLRLADLARMLGRSVGWLSQVERGLSRLPCQDLLTIARLLDVPLTRILRSGAPGGDLGRVTRQGSRRLLVSQLDGVREELLSPDLSDGFVLTQVEIAPGAQRRDPVRRDTREQVVVVRGSVDFVLDGARVELRAGDTLRLRGEPFTWANPNPDPCLLIWATAPAVL